MPQYRFDKLNPLISNHHQLTSFSIKLTNQILRTRRIRLLLGQIIKEQLDISAEIRIRRVRCRSQETVHLHVAVVSKVEVEVEACDGDGGDGRAGFRDGPNAAVATEPLFMSG
jgi:hypothetical protein